MDAELAKKIEKEMLKLSNDRLLYIRELAIEEKRLDALNMVEKELIRRGVNF